MQSNRLCLQHLSLTYIMYVKLCIQPIDAMAPSVRPAIDMRNSPRGNPLPLKGILIPHRRLKGILIPPLIDGRAFAFPSLTDGRAFSFPPLTD